MNLTTSTCTTTIVSLKALTDRGPSWGQTPGRSVVLVVTHMWANTNGWKVLNWQTVDRLHARQGQELGEVGQTLNII